MRGLGPALRKTNFGGKFYSSGPTKGTMTHRRMSLTGGLARPTGTHSGKAAFVAAPFFFCESVDTTISRLTANDTSLNRLTALDSLLERQFRLDSTLSKNTQNDSTIIQQQARDSTIEKDTANDTTIERARFNADSQGKCN